MDWFKACNGIQHEMWSKLAIAVKSIIIDDATKIKMDNLSEKNIIQVINILKNRRHLAIEERGYLRRFLRRAANFKINNQYIKIQQNQNKMLQYESLLIDIFYVYKIFIFTNFNFREHTINDFKKHIQGR
eukprot:297239_1